MKAFFLYFLLISSSPLILQYSSAGQPTRIEGYVTDNIGNPLPDVSVFRKEAPYHFFSSTTTDSNGFYFFYVFPEPSSYYIGTTGSTSYVGEWFQDTPLSTQYNHLFDDATLLTLTNGEIRQDINLSLSPGNTLQGKVLSTNGLQLLNAELSLFLTNNSLFKSTASDSNGCYAFSTVPDGTYYLHAAPTNNYIDEWHDNIKSSSAQPSKDNATPLTLAGDTVTSTDFHLDEGYIFCGSVFDENTNGIASINVICYDTNGYFISSSLSDTNGGFRIEKLLPGTYRLLASDEDWLDEWHNGRSVIHPYQDIMNFEIEPLDLISTNQLCINFELSRGGSIEGFVYDANTNPIANGIIRIHEGIEYRTLGTGGFFQISGLLPGTYYLQTEVEGNYVDEWYNDTTHDVLRNPIHISGTEIVSNIFFFLEPGNSITGRVTSSHSPVNGFVLYKTHEESEWQQVSIGILGAYTIDGLNDGVYCIRTKVYLDSLINEDFDNAHIYHPRNSPLSTNATFLALSNQTTKTANFHLELGGHLTGQVLDTNSNPLASVPVGIYTEDGTRLKSAYTDLTGFYQFDQLPSGSVYLATSVQEANMLNIWYSNSWVYSSGPYTPSISANLVETIAGGTVSNINFVLRSGGSISGTVTEHLLPGQPTWAIGVSALHSSGNWFHTALNSNGTYSIDQIPPGSWHVRAKSDYNGITEWYDSVHATREDTPNPGATLVTVNLGENVTNINFTLDPGGTIEAFLQTCHGIPAFNTDFYVYGFQFQASAHTPEGYVNESGGNLGDPSGLIFINGLPPGDYYVSAHTPLQLDEWYDNIVYTPGSDPNINGATPIVITGTETQTIYFSLCEFTDIMQTTRSNGYYQIYWAARTQMLYEVYYTSSLNPPIWTPCADGITPSTQHIQQSPLNRVLSYSDPVFRGNTSVYYRILGTPIP